MSWLKVDDGFPGHHKLDPLLDDPLGWSRALAVWLVCGCYAARHKSNGRVTALRIKRECAEGIDVDAAFADLCDLGLLDIIDGEYWIHDFLEYNPSSEKRDMDRKKSRERQKAFRNRRLAPDAKDESNAVTNADVTALRTDPRNAAPVPTRPHPTPVQLSPASGDRGPLGRELIDDGRAPCVHCGRMYVYRFSQGGGGVSGIGHHKLNGKVCPGVGRRAMREGERPREWVGNRTAPIPSFRKRRTKIGKTIEDVTQAHTIGRLQLSNWERGLGDIEPMVVDQLFALLATWEETAEEAKAAEPQSDHAELIAEWVKHWQKLHGQDPVINGETGKHIKTMLALKPLEECKRRMRHMVASLGQWPVKQLSDISLRKLATDFDSFASSPKSNASKYGPVASSIDHERDKDVVF